MAEIKVPLPTNNQMEELLKKTRVQRKTYPLTFSKKVELTTPTISPIHISEEGIFYGYNRTYEQGMLSSPDLTTITNGKAFGKSIINIKTTETHILCAVGVPGQTTELWRCPKTGDLTNDWVKVWEGAVSHNIPVWGGLKVYNTGVYDFVFVCEYAPVGNEAYAYMSKDGGETFNVIYTLPGVSNGNTHMHDIEYDEYSGRIWIAIGDYTSDKLIYSKDLGQTWVTAITTGFQATTITAFSRYIVLGSDYSPVGIYRFDKEKEKIEYLSGRDNSKAIEIAYVNELGTTAATSFCFGAYKKNDWEAYFGFSVTGGGPDNATIIGTGDGGETFYPLFSQVLSNSGGFSRSIAGIKSNSIYAPFLTLSEGDILYCAKLSEPTWKDL